MLNLNATSHKLTAVAAGQATVRNPLFAIYNLDIKQKFIEINLVISVALIQNYLAGLKFQQRTHRPRISLLSLDLPLLSGLFSYIDTFDPSLFL